MFNRAALLAASLTASAALAVGLALVGFAPAAAPVAAQPAAAATGATTTDAPAPITQVDTVYVAPQPTPQQITIQKVVTSSHGDDDGNEGGGDH